MNDRAVAGPWQAPRAWVRPRLHCWLNSRLKNKTCFHFSIHPGPHHGLLLGWQAQPMPWK